MATVYGTQNALAFDSNGDPTGVKVDGKYIKSNVHVIYDTRNIVSGGAGAVGAGDTIRMGGQQLPAGAVILDAVCYCNNLVSTTIDFGYTGASGEFNSTAAVGSAVLRTDEAATGTVVLSSAAWVEVDSSAAQTNAANRSITVVVFYATN